MLRGFAHAADDFRARSRVLHTVVYSPGNREIKTVTLFSLSVAVVCMRHCTKKSFHNHPSLALKK